MLRFAAALVACLSASATAFAADPANSGSLLQSEPVYNWAGIYAGASVATAWDEMKVDKAEATFGRSRVNGFLGTIQLGFNKQYRSFVFGLETDFSLSNVRGDNTNNLSGKYGSYSVSGVGTLEASLVSLGTIRTRVGYASGNKLVYLTAGYAYGRSQLEMSGSLTAQYGSSSKTAADAGSSREMLTGWAFGGGYEYAFARGMSLKGEYLRIQLNPATFFGGTWAASPARADIDLFRLGANFRI